MAMQIFRTILGMIVTGAVVVACAVNQNDCDKNPELSCYPGHTGAGGNTMTAGGAGGGGSASCTTPAQCPSPSEKCKVVTCEAGVCGEKDKDCGALGCDPISGTCGPCDDANPQKTCPQKDCYNVACVDGKCVETVNGALPCNNGQGTCDDAGSCGKCDDGVQNRGRSRGRLRSSDMWPMHRRTLRGWRGLQEWLLRRWGVLRCGM